MFAQDNVLRAIADDSIPQTPTRALAWQLEQLWTPNSTYLEGVSNKSARGVLHGGLLATDRHPVVVAGVTANISRHRGM